MPAFDGAKPRDIRERTFAFALRVIKLRQHLDATPGVSWLISKQLFKAGTSIGANVEESEAAQSKPDFISKRNIALKEARETIYWLRLLIASGIVPHERAADILQESIELAKILGSIVASAKRS